MLPDVNTELCSQGLAVLVDAASSAELIVSMEVHTFSPKVVGDCGRMPGSVIDMLCVSTFMAVSRTMRQ